MTSNDLGNACNGISETDLDELRAIPTRNPSVRALGRLAAAVDIEPQRLLELPPGA